jgi:decaprenylphospho-beta-D-erythro-pentofuranosid-2-ulose 2-reductase
MKSVLVLGANSDVAKEAVAQYVAKGYRVIAASRSVKELGEFVVARGLTGVTGGSAAVRVEYFDAVDFGSHRAFYEGLGEKPNIVVYTAGFQVTNEEALVSWEGSYRMMNVLYAGAVSILNIIAMDEGNTGLERIVGLSSLSGVRGRKSNFIYGSTKAAFTTYLAGLRQYLFARGVVVNAIVSGYIRSKLTAGLELPESLVMEPAYVARHVVEAPRRFVIVPGWKWKIIYWILKLLPEGLVAKLP